MAVEKPAGGNGFSPPQFQQKICGQCGDAFSCSAPSHGCWCEAVKIGSQVLASLRQRYSDCLCPRCLGEYAAKNSPSPLGSA